MARKRAVGEPRKVSVSKAIISTLRSNQLAVVSPELQRQYNFTANEKVLVNVHDGEPIQCIIMEIDEGLQLRVC